MRRFDIEGASLEIAVAEMVPDGWWWTVGACSVSCHASVGPDMAHNPREVLDAFDGGFHTDLPQPSTVSAALATACLEARKAIEARK